ncbi:MAG: hypothetical protein RL367_2502 [Pseudomonadota bacterium]|jgi:hypothetical protein
MSDTDQDFEQSSGNVFTDPGLSNLLAGKYQAQGSNRPMAHQAEILGNLTLSPTAPRTA